ncbi:FMN-binding glutamate synthase family protein [Calidifontibacter sp. DB0510]|uniref:FMN-binding glutamate synthase family protein n=1 Tax=Metallococcus carri TaxID=1656884 RepID=A0A967E9N0_9MICO|nr:FMN-binding glutamate synthase family protein [Metallococcus carri]NHN55024.1 FMN-binding glutamate synthase family protein [Metallococcus carri]NOP37370.1 FMN-binding glutamate synthase family protein [Calidifontibacter sp. DB2511S]
MSKARWFGLVPAAFAAVATHDLFQKKHSLLRNYPVLGHGRYLLETIGPELRQYIVAGNDEERPFSRAQRSWIYASAKGENNYIGFGTDNDVEDAEGYLIIKHRTFAVVDQPTANHHSETVDLPSAKVLGGPRNRPKAFRPGSVVNISAMSFGSLSANAIAAINRGAKAAGALHNTGEGGLSEHHRQGGDLIWQIGTGYFGCRDERGRFDIERLKDVVASAPVRALEIKLSQGAKPGLGGVLPAAKVTAEIAAIRGVPEGQDVISPSRHTEFRDCDSLLDFVERLASETGLPVGVKSAVGHHDFWDELAAQMAKGDRGVDFLTIDGGEGGTGAAPLVFADGVALPFYVGFTRVYAAFARAGLTDQLTFVGSGKLGLPLSATAAFALGADMINVAREAMLAVGCLQTQKCHTDTCPTGVATQNSWLAHGLDPAVKAPRVTAYLQSLRRDLLKVSEAVGVLHPSLITPDDLELLFGERHGVPLREVYGYEPGWGQLSPGLQQEITTLMVPETGEATANRH